MDTKKSVSGIYLTPSDMETAVAALKRVGFSTSVFSLLLPESLKSSDLVTSGSTKAPGAATTGAGSGAVVGGAIGRLAATGGLIIPGIGAFLAAGPLLPALLGIGVGGALGGFAGALIGLGIPVTEAEQYERRVQKGGILLSVHCETPEEIKQVKALMEVTGAEDVSVSGQNSLPEKRTA